MPKTKFVSIAANFKWFIISLLLIGISIRVLSIAKDYFGLSYDDYGLMTGVEKNFREFVFSKRYILAQKIPYWFSYRIFGGNMLGYHIFPLISGIAALIVLFLGIRKYWHSTYVLFFTLLLLAYNHHLLWLVEYTMFSYGHDFFISVIIFFLFLSLSEGSVPKRYIFPMFLLAGPLAFFSTIITLVPICCGIISVVIYRLIKFYRPQKRIIFPVKIMNFAPFVIFPVTYLIIYTLQPYVFTDLTAVKRPDMMPLYFLTSGFDKNIIGLILFSITNTIKLFIELLVIDLPSFITRPLLFFGAVGGIFSFIRFLSGKEKDPKIRFTAIYFLITYSAILAGGILAVFPFGRARYNAFLLVPLVILMGYGMREIILMLCNKIIIIPILWKKNAKLFSFSIAIIILISGGYFNLKKYQEIILFKQQNQSVLEKIRLINTDQTYYTGYVGPVLYIKAKDIYDRGYDLGWGTEYGQVENKKYMLEEANNILVINNPYSPLNQFPSFLNFINQNYSLELQIGGSAISANVYRRKMAKT